MPVWVPTMIITSAVLLVNVFLMFYFKWVTDVEKQKQHLKWLAFWVVDVVSVGYLVWRLYQDTHYSEMVSPLFVVTVALHSGNLAFCSVAIMLRRAGANLHSQLLGASKKHTDNFGRHLDHFEEVLNMVASLKRTQNETVGILQLLMQNANLSPENGQKIKELLVQTAPDQTSSTVLP